MNKNDLLELLNDMQEVAEKSLDDMPKLGIKDKYNYYSGYYTGILETVKRIKKAVELWEKFL